jgi:cell division protein FtsQ
MAARRRPRLIAGTVAVVVVLAGVLVWLGWFSTLVVVRQVDVRGVPAAQIAAIRAAAAVPMGVPLMRVDTAEIRGRLERDRTLRDVRVSRELPGTIVVAGTPRVAVLAVRNPKGQVEVVDAEGVVFRTVSSPPKGVPLVAAGSELVTASGLRAALQALAVLSPALRAEVSGMTVTAADHVTFTLNVKSGTRTVVWGGIGDARTKARLVEILAQEPGRTIDVSVPESPVTR